MFPLQKTPRNLEVLFEPSLPSTHTILSLCQLELPKGSHLCVPTSVLPPLGRLLSAPAWTIAAAS